MTLIRHSLRGDTHWAHDTERPDVNGCYVSGRQGKVITGPNHPCPQCGGYGAVVAIQKLPRNEYPHGSVIPERYRLHRPDGMNVSEPEPIPMVTEPLATEPIAKSDEQVARDMATAIMNAMVPEAAKIRETIEQAVNDVTESVRDENVTAISNAIDLLSERFDETVRRLIVPTRIEIKHENREPIQLGGTVHKAFAECLEWLQARDHENRPRNLFLTGPAGCGKTTLARQLAIALDVPFYTTGQVISEHQVVGFTDAGGSYHITPFAQAFRGGGLWLGDEFDAWGPEAALSLNGALANGHASFPDSPDNVAAHENNFNMVAGNTWGNGADREYVGRNEMDAASLSRFVTIPMDYDQALETEIAGQWTAWRDLVWRVRENTRDLRIRVMVGTRELVHGVSALNAGMDAERVAVRILRRDLDDVTWGKVIA